MQKATLDAARLDVESFGLVLEDVVVAVLENVAPAARTFQRPAGKAPAASVEHVLAGPAQRRAFPR
ncbi:MAG TPA: hypothetical protein VFJ82_15880 [Longimicrobium sp.]|nr:hypothetical protein [Longimicrobium sp.]